MTTPLPQHLRDAATALSTERVALQRVVDVHGPVERGTLLVLLAAPCVLPVPGVGTVLGMAMAVLALAMWRGHPTGNVPQRVADLELSRRWAQRVLGLLANFYALAGHLAKSRLISLAEPSKRSSIAAIAGLMAVLIILPIPFGNLLPALSLIFTGLGLAFRDGVAILLGVATAVLAVLFTATLAIMAWYWGSEWLQHLLPN